MGGIEIFVPFNSIQSKHSIFYLHVILPCLPLHLSEQQNALSLSLHGVPASAPPTLTQLASTGGGVVGLFVGDSVVGLFVGDGVVGLFVGDGNVGLDVGLSVVGAVTVVIH